MELFKNYQREFDSTIAGINTKLTQLPNYLGERRKTFLREIEIEFETAKEALDNMKHVANTARGGDSLRATIKVHEKDYERWMDQFKSASLGTGRTAPAPPTGDDWGVANADQRGKIIQDRQRLGNTSNMVSTTVRMATETEAIGRSALEDLKKQREQLDKGDRQLDEVDENVTGARRILTIMKRRVITNKIILVFIILVLFAAEIAVVWFRWIGPLIAKNNAAPTAPTAAPIAAPVAPAPVSAPH